MTKKLALLLEENNKKSPEVIAVTLVTSFPLVALRTATVYEEVTKEDLPFDLSKWHRTITSLPVWLYFPFKNKRTHDKFLKTIILNYTDEKGEVLRTPNGTPFVQVVSQ